MMKKATIISAMAFAFIMMHSSHSFAQEWTPVEGMNVSINEATHDFGTQKLYTKTEFEFKVRNDSSIALAISNISTSCGCTTPTYSKRPVKSGKVAIIKVSYDSARIGAFNKSIHVYTNFSTEPIELYIKGTMEEDKKETDNQ